MNAVFGSLLENLREINLVIQPTVEVFKGDRTNTSDAREATVQDFVRKYLPADFQVKERAKIYSITSSTNNIDCVVLAPNHPQLITPARPIVLAEGVYAAIEVKPDISVLTDSSELMRGLTQIKSVKNIQREIQQLDLSKLLNTAPEPEYNKKIPAVLFSFKSTDIDSTISFIISKITDGTLETDEIPDLIVTMDKGVIFYTPHLSSTNLFKSFSPEQIAYHGEKVFIHFQSQAPEVILAVFLLFFLNFTPPMLLVHDFIIKQYLTGDALILQNKVYPVETNPHKGLQMVMKKVQNIFENDQNLENPSNKDFLNKFNNEFNKLWKNRNCSQSENLEE